MKSIIEYLRITVSTTVVNFIAVPNQILRITNKKIIKTCHNLIIILLSFTIHKPIS